MLGSTKAIVLILVQPGLHVVLRCPKRDIADIRRAVLNESDMAPVRGKAARRAGR